MSRVGLTIGKFMPPHKGHELMIDLGAALCDEMIVLVSGKLDDPIPLELRYHWIADHYQGTNVHVMCDIDDIEMSEVDENGVATDPEFWRLWVEKIEAVVPEIAMVFTSDPYGRRLADELGARWVPADPRREMVKINATRIRNDPFGNFEYLMDEAKEYFAKKIVFIGPESCGKSTFTERFAKIYNTVGVLEYGRILAEVRNNEIDISDFFTIAEAQQALTKIMSRRANRFLFQDTELITTYLFAKIYLGVELLGLREDAFKQNFDLYVLLAPTVPWVDDGTRILPSDKERWDFFHKLEELLIAFQKPYVIVDADGFGLREDEVRRVIEERFL